MSRSTKAPIPKARSYNILGTADFPVGNFFCGCCQIQFEARLLAHLWWHSQRSFCICVRCLRATPMPIHGSLEPYSCEHCVQQELQRKKSLRLQYRESMTVLLDLQCILLVDLLVLIRDYAVDPQCRVRMTLDHFNEQTLPKSIVRALRRRRTGMQRRYTFIEHK